MRILLVDDDPTLVDLLTKNLVQQNYAVDAATDGEQGWIYGSTYSYDLMILDWFLPQLDGISLCQRFRATGYANPIILLSSRHGSQNKIKGLDAGADDYICKPFDIEELTARIRTLLRRVNCDFFPVLTWGKLQLNPCNCTVTYEGEPLSLGAKEYRLLELFLRHRQEVLSIEEIIDHLWSSNEYPAPATVRSHLRRLRQKLKLAGLPQDLIMTIRRQGYALKSLRESSEPNHNALMFPNQPAIFSAQEQDKKLQQIKALTAIWEKHQLKREQQLESLEQAIVALQAGNLATSDRVSAIIIAHSFAGNLGQFGLDRAAQLAKEIEQRLQNESDAAQLEQLSTKLQALRQELSKNHNISEPLTKKLAVDTPFLLIVNDDTNFTEQLSSEAQIQGMLTQVISTPRLVKVWLTEKQTRDREEQLPDVVLLNMSVTEELLESDAQLEYFGLIAEFNLLVPSIPVIVIADRDRLQDRLRVTRHGGKFYLSQPVSPSQIISVCRQAAQHFAAGKKIMIVDDDTELLKTLPILLKPWGFQITTLDDPRQFWDLLQAVEPDLLVLDIEMPHFSGIELCKVLRTHTYWGQLPVLFLSAHTDVKIFNQVFASGANDFINKPVIARELAYRILNRLAVST